jgi:D-apiose dehydrogenase
VILTLRHLQGALGWVESHSFLKHDDSKSTMDEATFEGDAGSIRINRLGEIWSGDERIWRDSGGGYRGDSVYATQAHFIDCLETGRPFETEARDYLEKTFAVVEAGYSSMASHRAVEITEILEQ